MTVAKKGLFEQFYNMTDEAVKKAKGGLLKKRLKRMLESAKDDALNKKLDAEVEYEKLMKNFDNFDINEILKSKATVISCEETIENVKTVYNDLFLEDMKQ